MSDATREEEEKQGSICCFNCCDFRRAVIIVSVISIVSNVIDCDLAVTGVSATIAIQGEDVEIVERNSSVPVAIAFGFMVLIGIVQIFGALRYNIRMLGVCLFFQLFNLGITLYWEWATKDSRESVSEHIFSSIIDIIIFGFLYIYPLVGLIKEIRAGTMTPETYHREAYSCCCVPGKQRKSYPEPSNVEPVMRHEATIV